MAQHDTCRFYIAEILLSSTVGFDHFTRHLLSQKDDVYAFFIAHEQMTAKHRLPAKSFKTFVATEKSSSMVRGL